jgi:hypothetical protein
MLAKSNGRYLRILTTVSDGDTLPLFEVSLLGLDIIDQDVHCLSDETLS